MEIDQSLGLKRENIFDRVLLAIGTGIFLLTVSLVTLQVLIRTFAFPWALAWTEPLSRLSLVVGTYFGAAVATRNNEHINMDILLRKLEGQYPRLKQIFDVLVYCIVTITMTIVVWSLYTGAHSAWSSNWPDIDAVTIGMVYLAIAIALTWMLGYEILKIKQLVDGLFDSDRVTGNEVER